MMDGNGYYGQNYQKLKLPELTSQSVVLRKELGEAYYGAVYLADVLPNLLYSLYHLCAAKVRNFTIVRSFFHETRQLCALIL